LSRLASSFVLGYHGCERKVGLEALHGDLSLLHSPGSYHWLGTGSYFWENDPDRALWWAKTHRTTFCEVLETVPTKPLSQWGWGYCVGAKQEGAD